MGYQVDAAIIQEPEHRSKPSISEAGGIPLIDLSPLLTTPVPAGSGDPIPEPLKHVVSEVEAACREWGFFQVINHGVPAELLDGIQAAAKEFFSLPLDEKRRGRRDEDNFLGYYDTEHTKNVRDWKEVFDFAVNDPMLIPATADAGETRLSEIRNRWPAHPPAMRDACMKYAKAVEGLAFKLLELISMSLNLPPKRLSGHFEKSVSTIRLNHYPSCPSPELALGVGRHKDPGALTVLSQDDVGGLDVRRRSDGQWVRVKPIPHSFIVNLGDLIQVWSNDRYESAEHRVSVNSSKERFSIPFFFNPAVDVTMMPLEEVVGEGGPAKYNEFRWGHFFKSRKSSNFQKLGVENLQICHFKKEV